MDRRKYQDEYKANSTYIDYNYVFILTNISIQTNLNVLNLFMVLNAETLAMLQNVLLMFTFWKL
jgi:hypothetical protein